MAAMHQQSQDDVARRRARSVRRRWLLLALLALALIRWVPQSHELLTRGWEASAQVLAHEREIEAAEARIEALEREIAYARTTEGMDVEAKRQFGVGPEEEIWITLEADEPRERMTRPLTIGDRVQSWLSDVGSECVDRVRYTISVLRYWGGLDSAPDLAEETVAQTEATLEDPYVDPEAPEAVSDNEGSDEAAGDATDAG